MQSGSCRAIIILPTETQSVRKVVRLTFSNNDITIVQFKVCFQRLTIHDLARRDGEGKVILLDSSFHRSFRPGPPVENFGKSILSSYLVQNLPMKFSSLRLSVCHFEHPWWVNTEDVKWWVLFGNKWLGFNENLITVISTDNETPRILIYHRNHSSQQWITMIEQWTWSPNLLSARRRTFSLKRFAETANGIQFQQCLALFPLKWFSLKDNKFFKCSFKFTMRKKQHWLFTYLWV